MKSILVIDDDIQVRQLLRQILEREGYYVLDAPDGNKGLKLYRQSPTDLIITDIIMPEKEGLETIRELKREFPDVKIIAISGGGHNLDAKGCLNVVKHFGVDYIFSKPFDRKELLEAIQKLLGDVLVS